MSAGFDMLVWGGPKWKSVWGPKNASIGPASSNFHLLLPHHLFFNGEPLQTSLHPPSSHLSNLFFLPSCQFPSIPPSIPLTVTVGLLLPLFLSRINKTCLCLVTYGHSSLWHTNHTHTHTYLIYKCVCVCVFVEH